jgi:hypothetical protein
MIPVFSISSLNWSLRFNHQGTQLELIYITLITFNYVTQSRTFGVTSCEIAWDCKK